MICNGIHPQTDLDYMSVHTRGTVDLFLLPGDGSLITLSGDPRGGNMVISRRNKALALAMLDLARENVEKSVES